MGDMFQRVTVMEAAVKGADYMTVLELRASGYWRWFPEARLAADHFDGAAGSTLFLARHVDSGAVGTVRARLLKDEDRTLEIAFFTVKPGRHHRRAARLQLWLACLALARKHDCARLSVFLPESFERECRALGLPCVSRSATLASGTQMHSVCLFSAEMSHLMNHLRQEKHPLFHLLTERTPPRVSKVTPPRPRRQSRAA